MYSLPSTDHDTHRSTRAKGNETIGNEARSHLGTGRQGEGGRINETPDDI